MIPSLLQGHLAAALPDEMSRALFVLRQYAGNLCSRLAWRKALSSHAEARSRSAYIVFADDKVQQREAVAPDLVTLLRDSLKSPLPYSQRELRFAEPGHAKVELRQGQEVRTFKIPHFQVPPPNRNSLPKRSVNPPISIKWERLLSIAREVDAREAAPAFPNGCLDSTCILVSQKFRSKASHLIFSRTAQLSSMELAMLWGCSPAVRAPCCRH